MLVPVPEAAESWSDTEDEAEKNNNRIGCSCSYLMGVFEGGAPHTMQARRARLVGIVLCTSLFAVVHGLSGLSEG